MDDSRALPQGWVPHVGPTRRALTVADEVVLALRAHQRQLGLSSSAYALRRGFGRAWLAELETAVGQQSLAAVSDALDGTGFALVVTFFPDDPDLTPDDGAAASTAPKGPGAREFCAGPTGEPTGVPRLRLLLDSQEPEQGAA